MPSTDNPLGRVLLSQARKAIADELGLPAPATFDDPQLAQRGATFATLTIDGELRGCIGSLNAHRALGVDVVENARAAAFSDPRFPPLSADEFGKGACRGVATQRTRVPRVPATKPTPWPRTARASTA